MAELTDNTTAEDSTAREDLTREIQTWTNSDQAGNIDALVTELLDSGWKSPDDTNALTNQATAYNNLMWRLAVAFGLAAEDDDVIDVDLAVLADRAITAARASVEAGDPA